MDYDNTDSATLDDMTIPHRTLLLATVPLFVAAAVGYVLVPLSVAVGRRPVLLATGVFTWSGALWAAMCGESFAQHLAARAFVAVGAAASSILVPLVAAHDLVFLHQRHTVVAILVAVQAIVSGAASLAAPYATVQCDWHWLYFVLATAGFVAWLAVFALVPESRWMQRTAAQLSGVGTAASCNCNNNNNSISSLSSASDMSIINAPCYADAPRCIDYAYGSRSLWTDVGILPGPAFRLEIAKARASVLDLARTALLPAVLWGAILNAALLAVQQAMVQQTAAAMLEQGLPLAQTGIGAALALMGGGLLTVFFAGPVAGTLSLAITRYMRKNREAEHNLAVLVMPILLAVIACFLFGIAAQKDLSWTTLAAATWMGTLAMLMVLSSSTVLLIESYPNWAGPCLAHAGGGLRLLAAGVLLQGNTAAGLISRHGLLGAWASYAEVLIVVSLGLPALAWGGRWVRTWAAGTVIGSRDEYKTAHRRSFSSSSTISSLPRALTSRGRA